MIPTTHLVAFVVAAVVIIIVPGPGVLFAIGRALVLGRRPALLSVLGHAAGVAVGLVAVAFGLGAIVAASAIALTIIKVIGAAYLIFLGVQAIRERKSLVAALDADVPVVSTRRVVWQGFVVGLSNPKSIVFFAAVLPQFVEPANGWIPVQMLILGAIFLGIAIVSDSCYALLAGSARNWFARSPRRLEAVGGAGGLMIVGVGASVAVSGTSH